MKTALCFILTLLTFVMLAFMPNSFAQGTQPENVVRVIYFLPKDRQPQQDIDTELDLLMKAVHQSYAEVMENQGFGRKSFPLETDNDGKVVVHHVTGLAPDVYYHTEAYSKVEKEIRQWFDPTTNIYFVVLDVSTENIDGAACGQAGAHGSFGGMSIIPVGGCLNVAVSAHELGHTFGLAHDRLRNANRASSSYHSDWMVTSFCAAEWLDVHAYFNVGENVSNENTQIQMLPSIASLPNSVRIRFQITDADGLHQAQVMLNGHLITCQKLKGQRDTYEFEWIPGLYGISDHLILRVIDVHGNFTEQNYPIDIAAMLPPPKVVSIPDTTLATAIREALNLAPGDPFTERNLLKLMNLDAENRQITDLTGLEHATQLQNLNLGGNQISDISPLASLEIVESLVLWDNQISDISVLTGLENLSWLNLSGNQIRDLNGLTDLPVLSGLDLTSNQIRDITSLAGLTQLRGLWLRYNHIPDISPLTALSHLIHLHLENNVISDVSPLAGLINLERLALDDNLIFDISPLDGLSENTNISLSNNPGFPIGGPKITGPWLWVIVPETRLDDSTDFLAQASGGEATELEVATNGAKQGTAVGDSVWTPHKLSDTGGDNINEMITALGWGTGEEIYDRIVYGSIVLDSRREQNTQMFVGSDDAVKVWLNGELVHQVFIDRGAEDYKDFFSVTLKQGKNVLLVAVDNRGWWWSSGFFGFAPDTEYTVLLPGEDAQITESPELKADVLIVESQRPPMYWIDVDAGTLHRLVGAKVENLLPNVQNATSLTVDVTNSKLYWTEKTGEHTGRIRRANLDGSNVQLVIDLTSAPLDLALDTMGGDLYLINSWGKVQRLNVDGSNYQPNFITELETPRHLTLDTAGGKVYWTEQTGDGTGKIRRANLDGSNVQLVKALTSTPLGLAADITNGKLYLSNSWGKIQRLNVDGSNYQPNFITDLESPGELAVDAAGGKLYWTEGGSLRRADLTGGNMQDVVRGLGPSAGITLGITPAPRAVDATVTAPPVIDLTAYHEQLTDPDSDGGGKWIDLKEQDVSLLSTLKSHGGNTETVIIVVNSTETEIAYYWVNYEGNEISYGKIAPGAFANQHTYAGHVWLIKDASGSSFAVFRAAEKTGRALIVEPSRVLVPPELKADVNADGTVNVLDLVLVAANLGKIGQNAADVNGDGLINILDLVFVAGALDNTAAAPSLHSQALDMLTASDVRQWLSQAQHLYLTDALSQRGILFLEQLLATLIPTETALLANYPNPFNPETWIPYQLSKPADVTLTIYAVNGHVVRRLALGHQAAGIYQTRSRAAYWDGRNAFGEPVASGVYFYVLTAGDFTATRKMLIRK